MDHLLNISDLGGSLNVLEGLINLSRVAHFLFHALTHVGVPQFLGVEIFTHFKLGAVLVFVGGVLSDFSVLALTLDTARD